MGLFGFKKSSSKKEATPGPVAWGPPSDGEYEDNTDFDSDLWDPNRFTEGQKSAITPEMMDVVREHVIKGETNFQLIFNALKTQFPLQKFSRRYLRCVIKEAERNYFGAFNDKDRLLEVLEKQEYVFSHKAIEKEGLETVFFAHPRALKLLRVYPSVLIIDHMFSIDACSWDLVSISGRAATSSTFIVGFAFIPRSTAAELEWVLKEFKKAAAAHSVKEAPVLVIDNSRPLLNACKATFPKSAILFDRTFFTGRVLYRSSDIDPNLYVSFTSKWMDLMNAKNEADFQKRMEKFESKFRSKCPTEFAYATDLMKTDKERMVSVWVQGYHHLNCLDENRIDNLHNLLESSLPKKQNLSAAFLALDRLTHTVIAETMGELLLAIKQKGEEIAQMPGAEDVDFHSYFTEDELNIPDQVVTDQFFLVDLKNIAKTRPLSYKDVHPGAQLRAPLDIVEYERPTTFDKL